VGSAVKGGEGWNVIGSAAFWQQHSVRPAFCIRRSKLLGLTTS